MRDAIHEGSAKLVDSVPVDGCEVTQQLVFHIHHHLVPLAYLEEKEESVVGVHLYITTLTTKLIDTWERPMDTRA